MHRFLKFFLVTLLAILFKPPSIFGNSLKINSSTIGPFSEFDFDQTISLSYSYKGNSSSIYGELYAYHFVSRELLYKSVTSRIKVSDDTKGTLTLPLKLRKFLSNQGLYLEINIMGVEECFLTKSFELFPIIESNVVVANGEPKRVTSHTVAFKIEMSNLYQYYDDFNFTNFKDYIDAENYYTLDIDKCNFLYNNDSLSYDSASVVIVDEKRILKNFYHDSEGRINLPIVIINNGEEKSFNYKNNFYVNRLTLESADYQLTNFVQTDKLYLPINMKNEFLGTKLILNILGAGYNKSNLEFNLTYDINRNLIGNCNDSDYCIKGEVE